MKVTRCFVFLLFSMKKKQLCCHFYFFVKAEQAFCCFQITAKHTQLRTITPKCTQILKQFFFQKKESNEKRNNLTNNTRKQRFHNNKMHRNSQKSTQTQTRNQKNPSNIQQPL